MVAIRLARTGAKKKPSYRVVVLDKRRARDSRNLEIVGHYNPRPDPIELVLKRERIDYWLGVGAQPSDTVRRLVRYFDEHLAPPPAEEPEEEPREEAVQTEPSEAKPTGPERTDMPAMPEPGSDTDDDDDDFPDFQEVEASARGAVEAEAGSKPV